MLRRESLLISLLLIVVTLTLLLSSCQNPTPTPEPTPTQGDGSDEIVITFRLEGGIAELCYELAIQHDGEYRLSSCKHAEAYGMLGGQFLEQLQEWDDLYAPFEVLVEDEPGNPKSLTRRLIWKGTGREPSSEETRQKMLSWIAELPIQDLRSAWAEMAALREANTYLANLLSIDGAQVTLISYEPDSWPDASLGCPQEGRTYAQVTTAGYSITFMVANRDYEVHTNADGSSTILCVKPAVEDAFTTYVSSQLSFSIAHPEHWTPVFNERKREVVIAPEGGEDSLGIAVTLLGDGHTIGEARSLLDDYKSSLPSQYPSIIFVAEPEEIETAAARGNKMSYQITLANDSVRQYIVAVLVDNAGNAFRLLLWTPQEDYWDHAGEYSKVLHSFQPLQTAAPTAAPSAEPGPGSTPTTGAPEKTPVPTGMFVGTFEGYIEAPNIPSDRASVRGKVLDANGNPMVGHALQLSAFDWKIDAFTGGDGSYAFDWLDNELTFTVTPLSFPGNPVEVLTDFGKAGIVNYQQQP
ncbi:MAG: hypothetical protein L6435_16110 [Anaerolineae bacterium]|nr:hypothetical protein [Anaerolineae bacterium]